MKKTISFILFSIITLSLVFAGGKKESSTDTSLNYVLDKGTFILGLDDSFPPMGFRNEKNEIVGFDIDLAREVCFRLGVELILQPIDWDAKEQELATKQIDCIWNGFTINPKRLESMTFSNPYLENSQVIVVKKDSPVNSLKDLSGKEIGLQAGSSAQDAVEANEEFKKSLKGVIEFSDNLTALMDLTIGGCDAVAMDLVVAEYSIKTGKMNLRILDQSLTTEQYAIGFRLGDFELCNKINSILLEMSQDGTIAEISEKWFGSDITTVGK